MRARILPIAGVSVLALVGATAFASTAGATGHRTPTTTYAGASQARVVKPASVASVCYSAPATTGGYAAVSQNFTDAGGAFDIYDSQGVDDFTMGTCTAITDVTAPGFYFGGTGPATSENVVIYAGNPAGTYPPPFAAPKSTVICKYLEVKGKGGKTGTFQIHLKKPCKPTKKQLKQGLWVSVSVNMPYSTGQGEWGWTSTTSSPTNAPAEWANPGLGFGSNPACPKYANMVTCLLQGGTNPGLENDFQFTIQGTP